MNRKFALITLILGCMLAGAQIAYLVEANFLFPPNSIPYIHIKNDGSIEPSTAPITKEGNTYTLTSNITGHTLSIECDNVIIDGAKFTISGDNKSSPAISIGLRSNVTVKHICIMWFCSAHLSMGGATECIITNSTIFTVAGGAMTLNGCNNCSIINNTFHNADLLYDDGRGESVYCGGENNFILNNTFSGGEVGLVIYGSNNTIINNTFTGTKKYLFSSHSQLNTIENNTVNDQIISEAPYISSSHSPILTQKPSNDPTQTITPTPLNTPTVTPIMATLMPSKSPSSTTTQSPSPSEIISQPTATAKNQPDFPLELTYAAIIIVISIITATITVLMKNKKSKKLPQS